MQTVGHIKYNKEATHNNHHQQPSNKRQKMLLNDRQIAIQHRDIILHENILNPFREHKMAIITPKINSYREPSDTELAIWSSAEMERCSYENFLNYHVQFLVHDQSTYDTHYMAIRTVEESAVSMAINEHGLHGQSKIESSQPPPAADSSAEARITVAVSTVSEAPAATGNTLSTVDQPNTMENAVYLGAAAAPLVCEDNYDFMEVAVSAAIERNGLISFSR